MTKEAIIAGVILVILYITLMALTRPDCPEGSHAVVDRYWHCEAR